MLASNPGLIPCLDTLESSLIEEYNARAVYTEFSNDCLQLSDNDTNGSSLLSLIPLMSS